MTGVVTRCKGCGRAIQEKVLAPPGMAPALYWAHFTEAAYFTPAYHEPEPVALFLGEY